MTQKSKKSLAELNLVDRFLLDETMEDPEAYQATVEILLEKELEFLTKGETEKELRISTQVRAVRLDVVNMDTSQVVYYMEMQKSDTKNLRKRSRYYQAQLDASLLEPGVVDFNLLNDTCFILVAPFDIFGRGLYRYTFEGMCRECPDLKIEDGAVRIFINTKGKNRGDFSQEFLDFMDYITESTDEVAARSASSRIKLIHKRVKQVRESEKVGVKYMQLWEEKAYERIEGREEGIEIGRMVGEQQKLISQIVKKLTKNKTVNTIAEELEESLDVVQPVFDVAKKYAPEYDVEKIRQELYGEPGKEKNIEYVEDEQ